MATIPSDIKKRKVQPPIRLFNDDWTNDFLFIMHYAKPQCLICHETVAIVKKSNIQRHFTTKHAESFNRAFPVGTTTRNEKMESLKTALMSQAAMMVSLTSMEKRTTEASLIVSKLLAQAMVPYSHADLIKTCMIQVADSVP